MELIRNDNYYTSLFSHIVGPINIAIKSVCKNFSFSELYEIGALCNVLACSIRIVYPNIDLREDLAFVNRVFEPTPLLTPQSQVTILWTNTQDEYLVRIANNGPWNVNHFVPLMKRADDDESGQSSRPTPIVTVG